MDDRKKEIEEARKGLSLASLFPKPRPMWIAQAFYGLFGDAYVENTALENADNLAWSYTVLNFAMQRVLKQPLISDPMSGLDREARTGISDTLHAMERSTPAFKELLRMISRPNESQLLSFLRKLKKFLQMFNVGESLLLPAVVENSELLILIERTQEKLFRFVIIQTDPFSGLKHHAASAESMPIIKYRTCLVLRDVPKKNALDDVFWLALYNMAIHPKAGDIGKFYDILIPFLTGKPLETSLVEAEQAAAECAAVDTTGPVSQEMLDAYMANLPLSGTWRAPQRSQTAYVRCIIEALHYMLLRRGVTELQAHQVRRLARDGSS